MPGIFSLVCRNIPSTFKGKFYYLLAIVMCSIILSLNFKIASKTLFPSPEWNFEDYTYLEHDFPPALLPPSQHPRSAKLTIEDTVHYHPNDSADWASLFPAGSGGFVRLGPEHRLFGVSMFHQLHCLDKMRRAVIHEPPTEWERWHTQHCINYVRQMLLCASSTRLEPVKIFERDGKLEYKVDGLGLEHSCRDWSLLRLAVDENYERWPKEL